MIFVDTGFFIALAVPRDALHSVADEWSFLLRHRKLVTSGFVLIEVLNHFSKSPQRIQGQTIVNYVMRDPMYEVIPVSESSFLGGLDLHTRRNDKNWSLTDCISFHLMQTRGIRQALAFDQHFDQAGFDPLLRRRPDETP